MATVKIDGEDVTIEEEEKAPEVQTEEPVPSADEVVPEPVDPIDEVTVEEDVVEEEQSEDVPLEVLPETDEQAREAMFAITEEEEEPGVGVFEVTQEDEPGVGVFDEPTEEGPEEEEYVGEDTAQDIDGFEKEEADRLRAERLEQADAISKKQVEMTTLTDGSEQPDVEDSDSWGLAFVKGAYDVPITIAMAVPRVLNETAMAVDDLLELANDVIPENIKQMMGYNPSTAGLMWFMENAEDTDPAQIPVREPTTMAGDIVAPISDFVVGFIPVLRGVKLATLGVRGATAAVGMYGRAGLTAAEYTGAAAVTNFFVWDPHEANLARVLNETEVFGQDLSGVWTEMLATDPADSDIVNRMKNVVEGLLMDVVLLGAGKAIKSGVTTAAPVVATGFRNVAAVKPIAAMLTQSMELMRQRRIAAGYTGRAVDMLSDDGLAYRSRTLGPKSPEALAALREGAELRVVPAYIEAAFRAGKATIDDVLEHVNFEGFTNSQAIADTLDAFTSGLFKQADNIRLRFEAEGKPLTGPISDPELENLAVNLGFTPEQLLSRRTGTVTTEELVAAGEMLLNGTRKRLIELAGVAKTTADTETLWEFAKLQNIYKAMSMQVNSVRSQQGRGLRAVAAFSERLTKETLDETDAFLNRMKFPEGNARQQMDMLTNGVMDQGTAKQLQRLAKLMEEGTEEATEKIMRGSLTKRITDVLIEYTYFSFLSGTPTLMVNTVGTGLSVAWNIPESLLSATASAARRKLTGSAEGVQFGEAAAMAQGFLSSVYTAYRAAARTYRTGGQEVVHSKLEARVASSVNADAFGFAAGKSGELNLMQKGWNHGLDAIGWILSRPGRLLMTTDEFLGSIAKDQSMSALAFRQATSEGLEGASFAARVADIKANPSKWMVDESLDFARATTFTRDLGTIGKAAQEITNVVPLLKLQVPFIRTPANLMKWAAVRTPLGLLARSTWADLAQGGAKADAVIGRMASGSALMVAIANLTWEGKITSAGPLDPKMRETWLREGNIPYSIKMPWTDENGDDVWYGYSRLDPFATMIGASASLAEIGAAASEGELDEWGMAIILAAKDNVYSKTWLTGAGELFELFGNPEYKIDDFVQSKISNWVVPAFVRVIEKEVDPVWRDVETVGEAIRANIPGFSSDLPANRNLWGIPIHSATVGPAWLSFVATSSIDAREIDHWMAENNIKVNKPQRIQSFPTESGPTVAVELNAHERSRFLELSGNEVKDPKYGLGFYDTMSALADGTHPEAAGWAEANTAEREYVLRSIMSKFRLAARMTLLQENEELRTRVNEAGVLEYQRFTE